jgi:hypothetical protein
MTDLTNNSKNEVESAKQALLSLAMEGWRLSKVFMRAMQSLDAGEQNRYLNQCRYFIKQLEHILSDEGYRIVNLEGHPFDPGMAAKAVNLDDFAPKDLLVVDQMLEPVIMGNQGLVKMGTVLLRKVIK